jgi:HlyD family secretion protein
MQIKYFIFALSTLLLISCGGKKDTPVKLEKYKVGQIDQIRGVARIEPAAKISPLGGQSAGQVVEIHVKAGVFVKKGTLLVSLDQALDQAQISQSEAKLLTKQERIHALEAKVAAIRLKVNIADTEQKRDQQLAKAQAGTQKAAFDAENAYKNLNAELAIALADLAEAKALLGETKSEINYAKKLCDNKNIYAPSDGMVLNWDIKVGQTITVGSKLADYAPAGDLIAITEVDELFAMQVKNGQKVKINMQGTSNTLSTGTVVFCSPFLSKKSIFNDRADNLEDRRVREVHVRIDQPKAVLIGSRVECIISL